MIRTPCNMPAAAVLLAACIACPAFAASTSTAFATSTAERLSLDFQNVEVRAALQLIADFAGINLVAGDDVTGRITLHLQDVPWDTALELVLAGSGLGMQRSGAALLVAPAERIAERAKAELEQRRELDALALRQTAFIPIRYADAAALAAFGSGDGAPAPLADGAALRVDARTNSIILTDTADNIAAFQRIVDRLDVPMRQVWIEARIVNANRSISQELGVDWAAGRTGWADGRVSGNARARHGIANAAAGIGFAILGADYHLDIALSALAASGSAEIVARPNVVTADQRTALIESGVEVPYQQETHSGGTSIAFKEAVLQLEVTPRITPQERIAMELRVKQDAVGRIYQGVPSINTTRISTQVRVDDGETVVLGGIFQTDRHHADARAPLLGDMPLLGRLFRRATRRDARHELFIFITPRVLAHGD